MAGFLSRILAKGRGDAQAVQPLLPPLFAPLESGLVPDVVPPFNEEESESEQPASRRAAAFSLPVFQPEETLNMPSEPNENRPSRSEQGGAAALSYFPVSDLSQAQVKAGSVSTGENDYKIFRPDEAGEVPFYRPTLKVLPSNEEEKLSQSTASKGLLDLASGQEERGLDELLGQEYFGFEKRVMDRPEQNNSEAKHRLVSAKIDKAGEQPPQEQPPALPAIQINIGRVEVRAVPTPPAPLKNQGQKAAPKISLDEYLRSQGGGRR